MSGRNGRMAIFSCVYLLDAESVFFVVFVVLLGRYLCCGVIYIIYYLLIHFVYWNLQKKIEIQNKRICCPIRILVRIILMFVFLNIFFLRILSCHVILLLPFIFFKTCIKIKCEISNKTILECSHEFPTMDSYCVTLVSGRKSWGTINCIKYFDRIRSI